MCTIPAFASEDGKHKILVKNDLIYFFQNYDSMVSHPNEVRPFEESYNRQASTPQLSEQQQDRPVRKDGIRAGTLRTWYAYGWGNRGEDSNPYRDNPRASSPMFGYFPVVGYARYTDDNLERQQIKNSLKEFYDDFSDQAIENARSGTPRTRTYLDYMDVTPLPLYYIGNFHEELSIIDYYNDILIKQAPTTAEAAADSVALMVAEAGWTNEALIEAYYWFTESGFFAGPRTEGIIGPTLDQLLSCHEGGFCIPITEIIAYYEEKGWAIGGELANRYNAYLGYREDIETIVEGDWTREQVILAWSLGPDVFVGSILDFRDIFVEKGWEIPTEIEMAPDFECGDRTEFCSTRFGRVFWDIVGNIEAAESGGGSTVEVNATLYGFTVICPPSIPPPWCMDPVKFDILMTAHHKFQPEDWKPAGLTTWPNYGNWENLSESRVISDIDAMLNTTGYLTNNDILTFYDRWNAYRRRGTSTPPTVPLPFELLGPMLQSLIHEQNRTGPFGTGPGAALERGIRTGGFQDTAMELTERIEQEMTEELFPNVPAWIPLTPEELERIQRDRSAEEWLESCFDNLANTSDFKIAHWKRSLVAVKPFNMQKDIDDRYQNESFASITERQIKPSLNAREVYVPGVGGSDPGESDVQYGVSGPRRYYDYVFQFPVVDDQVEVVPTYNGYFASGFERSVDNLVSLYEPVIPNLYIVDFADTSVPEYYNLLSLNARTENYPHGYISEFNRNYEIGTPAYESLFEPFGYSNEYEYPRMWSRGVEVGQTDVGGYGITGLLVLSEEYKSLVFSEIYKQSYLNTTNEAISNSRWVPMYNKISFDFGEVVRSQPTVFDDVFNSPQVRLSYPYDPLTHLISDTYIARENINRMAEVNVGARYADPGRAGHLSGIAVLEGNRDYNYNENKIWDIHEWFRLYFLPDRAQFGVCWRSLYDQFPEQEPMLEWGATLTNAPWIFSQFTPKPIPIGADPEQVDFSQILASCPAGQKDAEVFRDDPTVDEYEGEVPSDLYTRPPSILLTPDGNEWSNPDSESVGIFHSALANLYRELSEKIETHFRSYQEVLDGKLAHSEPLFYRLQRVSSTGVVLQNYFFPASLLRDGFTYVDAQVKYGTQYDYTLHGYYLVIGNEYWYEDLESPFSIEKRMASFVSDNQEISYWAKNAGMSESQWLAEGVWPTVQNAYTDIDGETVLSESHLSQLASYAGQFGMDMSELWQLLIRALEFERAGRGTIDDYRARFPEGDYYSVPSNNHHVQFAVNNRPHVLLVEADVFSPDKNPTSTRAKIVDSPPMPPDVEIVPYRSVNDRVLLRINDSSGRYTDNPILINEGDFERYKDQIVMQNPSISARRITSANIERKYEITFDTDDYPRAFEIYRVEQPPLSYRSFANGSKAILDNTIGDEVFQTANSFIDSVEPNKKYWYTFRTVDVHGNLSNPSPILQFEMVDTGNSIFPVIEEYSFLEEPSVYTKPVGRYLMIAPSSNQQQLHEDVTDAQSFLDKPRLGPIPREGMWGKKYKLRVTSKLTGKKVDINFVFNQSSNPDINNLE